MTGFKKEENENNHIIRSDDGEFALWVGVVDDLWEMGKAVGVGGPWKETKVREGISSDPYLFIGFDKKTLKITLQMDITGYGDWVTYRDFDVKAEEDLEYEFPEGFNAYWVRAVSSEDSVVTVQFNYVIKITYKL